MTDVATVRLSDLYRDLRRGRITRRDFAARAVALGAATPVLLYALQATGAATTAQGGDAAPAEGTSGQQRGAAGELKLLQWQAPTHLSTHIANGGKDNLAATPVFDPLLSYLPDGTLIPVLAAEVPSVENGLLAPDRSAVTYRLRPGIVWSDGTPLTARDVVFTWRWVTDPANNATSSEIYAPIVAAEAVDDLTVRLSFAGPNPGWSVPFAGSWWGSVYPEHVLGTGPAAHAAFAQGPIGTGPFVVESFAANDQVVYAANPNYRDPAKPAFARVNLKGGGDAVTAAQSVLQTGDWDLAWNLQIEPAVLTQLATGGKGAVRTVPGTSQERLRFNFSDPNEEAEGQRAYWRNPHPFLTDPVVRQALALGVDRALIAAQFYGEGEEPTANVLAGIPAFESPNTTWAFDLDEAKRILDGAGWVANGDGVREKDGVALKLTYATTINGVRQKTQAVVKRAWQELGVEVALKQVDSGVFFDSAVGNEQNINHFYDDVHMSTSNADSPYPIAYMASWYSAGGANIAQASNGWTGANNARYDDPEYDALYEAARVEADPERSAELFIAMNDRLVERSVVVPIVQRAAEKYAISTTLRDANVAGGPFETLYWNIANWNRT